MKMMKRAMTDCSHPQQPMTGRKGLQTNKRSILLLAPTSLKRI
jgi:hypothetical protein